MFDPLANSYQTAKARPFCGVDSIGVFDSMPNRIDLNFEAFAETYFGRPQQN